MSKKIEIGVSGSFVTGDNVVIGAKGSNRSTVIRVSFGDDWETYHKYVTLRDALGENPVVVMLTPDKKVSSDGGGIYEFNVPATPLAKAGMMLVTFKGYTVEQNGDDAIETEAEVSAAAYFRVLPSNFIESDDDLVEASVAEQLEAAINDLDAEKYEKPAGGIPTSDIANGAVTTAKIADGSVTTDKIATESVTYAKLSQTVLELINKKANKDYLDNSVGTSDRAMPKSYIDSQASAAENNAKSYAADLADDTLDYAMDYAKEYTDAKVEAEAADYRGAFANWASVPTQSSGYQGTPNNRDIITVLNASDYGEDYTGTWRFKYTGEWSENGKNGWAPEEQMTGGSTPLTPEQAAALNSGITASILASLQSGVAKAGKIYHENVAPDEDEGQLIVSITHKETNDIVALDIEDGDEETLVGVIAFQNGSDAEFGNIYLTNGEVASFEKLKYCKITDYHYRIYGRIDGDDLYLISSGTFDPSDDQIAAINSGITAAILTQILGNINTALHSGIATADMYVWSTSGGYLNYGNPTTTNAIVKLLLRSDRDTPTGFPIRFEVGDVYGKLYNSKGKNVSLSDITNCLTDPDGYFYEFYALRVGNDAIILDDKSAFVPTSAQTGAMNSGITAAILSALQTAVANAYPVTGGTITGNVVCIGFIKAALLAAEKGLCNVQIEPGDSNTSGYLQYENGYTETRTKFVPPDGSQVNEMAHEYEIAFQPKSGTVALQEDQITVVYHDA